MAALTWSGTDRRDDPKGLRAALYYTYSVDGGQTWQPNTRLTEPFDPSSGYPDASYKIGEYIGIVSLEEEVRLVYTATFGGEQNLYCLRHRPYLGDLNGDRCRQPVRSRAVRAGGV